LDSDYGSITGDVITTECFTNRRGVGCVRHHIEGSVVVPPDDDVVEHSPVIIQQVGVLRSPWSNFVKVIRQSAVHTLRRVSIGEPNCSKMGDIEYCTRLPARKVLANCAGVFKRHVPAAKRCHPR
jgi:hypothetical protein